MLHDTGAYLPPDIIVPFIATSTTLPRSYVIPAYKIESTVALTNRVPTTVVRGAGRPQGGVRDGAALIGSTAQVEEIDRAPNCAPATSIKPDEDVLFAGARDLPRRQADGLCQRRLRRASRRAIELAKYESFRASAARRAKARAEGL